MKLIHFSLRMHSQANSVVISICTAIELLQFEIKAIIRALSVDSGYTGQSYSSLKSAVLFRMLRLNYLIYHTHVLSSEINKIFTYEAQRLIYLIPLVSFRIQQSFNVNRRDMTRQISVVFVTLMINHTLVN